MRSITVDQVSTGLPTILLPSAQLNEDNRRDERCNRVRCLECVCMQYRAVCVSMKLMCSRRASVSEKLFRKASTCIFPDTVQRSQGLQVLRSQVSCTTAVLRSGVPVSENHISLPVFSKYNGRPSRSNPNVKQNPAQSLTQSPQSVLCLNSPRSRSNLLPTT